MTWGSGDDGTFFAFLKAAGLTIAMFTSDRHQSIAKWIREQEPTTKHFFIWYVAKSVSKRLPQVGKESGYNKMKQILMNTRILNEDLTWTVHCAYIVKANRWLYALRQLKKCKVPSADIVHIYCTLIRSILEYTTVLFAGLLKYLTGNLENV